MMMSVIQMKSININLSIKALYFVSKGISMLNFLRIISDKNCVIDYNTSFNSSGLFINVLSKVFAERDIKK